jgi:dethiobiotin synthetase
MPAGKGFFVTGTGTEVGKTVIAAVLAHDFRRQGMSVSVFKPAVTGLDGPGEADHHLLRRAAESDQSDDEIAPYRYGPPASPHLAAAEAGEEIEPERLRRAAGEAAARAESFVCEGVGGLLVPLACRVGGATRDKGDHPYKVDPPYLVRDLAADLGLPLVIAASPGLGTINHTLLTIEAARASGLTTAVVVLTPWPTEPSAIERSNQETIEALGEVRVATLPQLDLATPETWPRLEIEPELGAPPELGA